MVGMALDFGENWARGARRLRELTSAHAVGKPRMWQCPVRTPAFQRVPFPVLMASWLMPVALSCHYIIVNHAAHNLETICSTLYSPHQLAQLAQRSNDRNTIDSDCVL